jgi:hypothetical protein
MAALLATEKGRTGIYNLAEPNSCISTQKARSQLGFEATNRLGSSPQDATAKARIIYSPHTS